MKKCICVIILLIISAVLLVSCSSEEPEENTEIAASLGDDIFTVEELEESVSVYLENNGLEWDSLSESRRNEICDECLNGMIESEIKRIKVKELGYDNLGYNDRQIVSSLVSEMTEYIYGLIDAKVEQENPEKEEAPELWEKYYADYVEQTGESADYLFEHYSEQVAEENMFDELTAKAEPSEEDIEELYEKYVAEDKKTYEEHPDWFSSDATTNMLFYSLPGFRAVKRIESSYYGTLKNIYAELDGDNFDEYAKRYSFGDAETLNGYYVVGEASTEYDESFKNAALALISPGDISPIVELKNGNFCVILYYDDIAPGGPALETVYDELYEEALSNAKNEEFGSIMATWKEKLGAVKFTGVYKYVLSKEGK